jgi:hypothetical protein
MVMEPQRLFYSSGALMPDYPYYVQRQADRLALVAMRDNKLVYTIAPRQMGKTSLLKRLALYSEEQGWTCCHIDLATFSNLEPPKWFQHLGERIGRACGKDTISSPLQDQQDFRTFLLYEIGLKQSHQPVSLFMFFDEVEGLLEFDFSDEFLMTLRELYQQRDSYSGNKLLIAFAGSVDPDTLVKNPDISPFNIAEKIDLDDFSEVESLTLTSNLTKLQLRVAGEIHQHIYSWTSGQPYLTQRICEIIAGWAEGHEITEITTDSVDRAVAVLLSPRTRDKNVKHVMNKIASLQSFAASMWRRLLASEPVCSTEAGFYALYLTGAVVEAPDERVKIRNRIYQQALANQASHVASRRVSEQVSPPELRQIITEHFSEEELRTLCFDLDIDYDNFPGQGKGNKARDLVAHFVRRERIYELIVACYERRPEVFQQNV